MLNLHPNIVYGEEYNTIAPGFHPMGGEIGPSLVDLQHLRLQVLNLDIDNYGLMIDNNLEWLSHLSSLKIFKLSNTNFTKATNWFQSIKTAPSLSSLRLYNCLFPTIDVINKSSSNSLTKLDIVYNTIHPKTIPWLLNISSNLVSLTFWGNEVRGPLPNCFQNIRTLAHIDLSYNEFVGGIPKSLGSLCNLQELSLSENNFNTTLSDVLESLRGCAKDSLEILDLRSNQLKGSFPISKAFPVFLKELSLYDDQLEGPLLHLSKFSSLRLLDVSYNKLNGTLPDDIGKLHHLKILFLKWNSFTGTLTEAIGELQHLENLDVSSNAFTGLVTEVHFKRLSNLKRLSFLDNPLTLTFNSTWVPPFQLVDVLLGSCKLGPQFPAWLKTQKKLSLLDISNAQIYDKIPNWFSNQIFELKILNLSSNELYGPIPTYLSNVKTLFLSNNMLHSLRTFLCEPVHGSIEILHISNNMLNGSLLDCHLNLKNLTVLKLDNNNFFGEIPRSIGLLHGIQYLLLGHNNFFGNLPSSLQNCTQLKVLDVEDNNLEGNIPTWIGKRLTNLIFFRLKSNNLFGAIPSNLCHLQSVQIFDISMNNIGGHIPSCIKNFSSMIDKRDIFQVSNMQIHVNLDDNIGLNYEMDTFIMWKGVNRQFKEILRLINLINLSSNKLNGKIPEELTNLVELIELNISKNNLSGAIPANIGNLKKLQKGKIPIGTQLQSFDALMYIDNDGLCGRPLANSCLGDESPNYHQDHSSFVEDEEWFDMSGLHMGIGVGFVVGFAGICEIYYEKLIHQLVVSIKCHKVEVCISSSTNGYSSMKFINYNGSEILFFL
ncbi:receptor-like protein EIX2 [Humulus lupulus]|uniref:receptor-like protein EIX2 n=1 Tax=Humulus lupulus TaxID=3486 RepID=UPI002B409F9E|nr:receptor-like protein EIX2 [Humulus lupulus]